MTQAANKSQSGFTVIEVMVVLVIAAIIILVLFMAVPALQRNARNARRDRDAAYFARAIRECLQHNNLSIHACSTPEELHLNPAELSIYSTLHYGSTVFPNGSSTVSVPPTQEEPNWLYGLRCNANLSWFTETAGNDRTFVVTYFREAGSSGWVSRCIDG